MQKNSTRPPCSQKTPNCSSAGLNIRQALLLHSFNHPFSDFNNLSSSQMSITPESAANPADSTVALKSVTLSEVRARLVIAAPAPLAGDQTINQA